MLGRLNYVLTLWVAPMILAPQYWPLVIAELVGSASGWLCRHDPIWDFLVHVAVTSALVVLTIVGCDFDPAAALMVFAWYATCSVLSVVITTIVEIYNNKEV